MATFEPVRLGPEVPKCCCTYDEPGLRCHHCELGHHTACLDKKYGRLLKRAAWDATRRMVLRTKRTEN